MEQHIHIDLTKIVSAITVVMCKPYSSFITKLSADGRITDAEVATLRQEIEDLGTRLDDLVIEHLERDRETHSTPS